MILNVYIPSNKASKYMKCILMVIKNEVKTDGNKKAKSQIVGSVFSTDKISSQRIFRNTENFDNTINQPK